MAAEGTLLDPIRMKPIVERDVAAHQENRIPGMGSMGSGPQPIFELQRAQRAGTLYVLDEPTTGLHPADVERLMAQLHGLVASGASVVVVEHDMHVIAASDWVIDMGPGAGDEGGRIVAAAAPAALARDTKSRTATYLARFLGVEAPRATRAGRPVTAL